MIAAVREAREVLAGVRDGHARGEGRVRLLWQGPVAEVVVDHPGARNALTIGMMEDLAEIVLALADWEGNAVLLRAEGTSFCAGGHLGEVRAWLGDPDLAFAFSHAMATVLHAFGALPQVSVAALQGPAVGGGVELATAADLRFAGPRATLELRQVALGVTAGWGGASRLVDIVGERTALRLLVGAARLDGVEAHTLGLVDVLAEDAVAAARVWLTAVAERPVHAVRAAKAQVRAAGDPVAQAEWFASVWGGPAHRRALARARP